MNKKNKSLIIITGLACLIAIGLVTGLASKKHMETTTNIDITGQPTVGQSKAPVSIIVFEDLKCPICAKFNNDVYPNVIKKYIDEGTAKYTSITLAFIPGSIPAGNMALALYAKNKDYFFPFVDYLYHHQEDEAKNWATIPTLLSFARNAMLPLSPSSSPAPLSLSTATQKELSDQVASGQYSSVLAHNLNIAEKAMPDGVATPTVYINGKKVEPLTENNLKTMLKQAKEAAPK